jgi:lipopolysaccharide/colanic/teichoic acid biosynthesis glycosyltransferase
MYNNAENGVPQLTTKEDDRITPFGAVMRRYRLDELPQFYNILKGEMSIVGPRPERKFFINQIMKIAPYYCLLYNVRPGLTSWGPIKVGYTDTMDKMVIRLKYDILYLENMSLLSDMQILFFTLSIIIKGKGL